MLRSLKVTDGWLKRVKQALSRYDFSSQKALAEELEISSRKTNDFFNGKSVDYEIFVAICARLGLDWQKVAKVSPETIKSINSPSKVSESKSEPKEVLIISSQSTPSVSSQISKPIENRPKTSESIPKLASSLFRSFDSQDRIAQKKFLNTAPPLNPEDQADKPLDDSFNSLLDNLLDNLPIQIGDRPQDISNNPFTSDKLSDKLVDSPIEEQIEEQINEKVEELFTKNPEAGVIEEIPLLSVEISAEITGNNPIESKPTEGVTQIQELLGIDSNLTQTLSLNPKTIAQIQELLGMVGDIKPVKASVREVKPIRDLELESLTSDRNFSVEEPINKISAIQAEVNKDISADVDISNEIKEKTNKAIDKEVDKEIDRVNLESIPSPFQLAIDNLESIISAYYDFCKVQDWDMAAAVVNSVNLAYIRKTADLSLILDLFNQLLPPKWQNGEQKIGDRLVHLQVICNAGMAAFYLDKFADAVGYYESVLAISSDISTLSSCSELKLKIKALNGLGTIYQTLAQYQSAIKYFQQAQVLATESENNQSKLQALGNLGNIYYALRQYRTAIAYYQEFLKLSDGKDLVELEFSVIGNLGNAFYNLKEYQTGIGYQQKYLEVAQTIGNSEKEAGCLVSLGFAYYALGLYQTAIQYYNQAKAIADRCNYKRIQVSVFSGLGLSYQALKNYPTAVICFHKCLEVARQVGDRAAEVRALYNLRKSNSYQLI